MPTAVAMLYLGATTSNLAAIAPYRKYGFW